MNIFLSLSKYLSKDITIHNLKIRNGFLRIKGLFRNGGRIAGARQSLAWENVEEAGPQTFLGVTEVNGQGIGHHNE